MSNQASSGGIGLGGLLFVVFVYLKLSHQIDWSWFWVASPLWIPIGLIAAIALLLLVVAGVADIVENRRMRRNWKKRNRL